VDGKLVAAASRADEGQVVLDSVLNWGDGEFEFRRVTEPPLDPDPALDGTLLTMSAAHFRSQRADNGRDPLARPLAPLQLDDSRAQQLAWFVESHPFIEHACIIDSDGGIRAQSSTNLIPINEVRALVQNLAHHSTQHPRPGLRRVIVEDERGILVLTRLTDGSSLMLMADPKTTTGALCAAATRFITGLEGGS
jgi:predicted regulator of Ras-like GTPase activity (Roadblock/LC7/MglB family)